MSQETFWISVDEDGQARRTEIKPVWDVSLMLGGCWSFSESWKPLPRVPVGGTCHGVGRGQCAQFKLVRVGEIIDANEET